MFNAVVVKYLSPVVQAVSRLVRGSHLLGFCSDVPCGDEGTCTMFSHVTPISLWGFGIPCWKGRHGLADAHRSLCPDIPLGYEERVTAWRVLLTTAWPGATGRSLSLPALLGNPLHFFPSQPLPHRYPSRPVTSTQPLCRARGQKRQWEGGRKGSPFQLPLLTLLLLPPTAGSGPFPRRGRLGELAHNLTMICMFDICSDWHLLYEKL